MHALLPGNLLEAVLQHRPEERATMTVPALTVAFVCLVALAVLIGFAAWMRR